VGGGKWEVGSSPAQSGDGNLQWSRTDRGGESSQTQLGQRAIRDEVVGGLLDGPRQRGEHTELI
jgi:hypothetical protein